LPEAGRHAPILIATSWQALGRAVHEGPDTLICNCTVVVLFAGFYVEASLNHIIHTLRLSGRLRAFANGNKYPGLQDKLAWFYNDFIARAPVSDLRTARSRGIHRKVRSRFPGFAQLYRFRNNIAHGVINRSGRSLSEAERLRQQAKGIVSELFAVLEVRGHRIRRATTYFQAIQS
jgi:hypothetical protein